MLPVQGKARHAVGRVGALGEGPHMIVLLTACEGRITLARFSTYACPAAQACGEWVCGQVVGKRPEELRFVGEAEVLAGVGAMPLGRDHCPALAVGALQDALSQLTQAQTEPGEVKND